MPREQRISKFHCWLCDLENCVQKVRRVVEILDPFKREVVKFEGDLQKLKKLADQVRGQDDLKKIGSSADDLESLLDLVDHFHGQYGAICLRRGNCSGSTPICGQDSY